MRRWLGRASSVSFIYCRYACRQANERLWQAFLITIFSIVVGYIDRVGNGFGYVAKLSATGNSAPTYDDDLLEVPNAALGVSQVVVGKDDQVCLQDACFFIL